jgi:hypothetical protein
LDGAIKKRFDFRGERIKQVARALNLGKRDALFFEIALPRQLAT